MAFGMATALQCARCIGAAPRDIAVTAQGSTAVAAAAVPSLSKNFSGLHCIDLSSPAASSSSSSLCNATTIQVRRVGVVRTVRPQSRKSRTLAVVAAKEEVKDILILGGTRFIGLFLARLLVKDGYSVTLLTRGKSPVTKQLPGETDEEYAAYSSQVKHIKADRQEFEALKGTLAGKPFTHVYDINGREAGEVEPILESLPNLKQYVFCSSAGVYKKSDLLPHREIDEGDPKSRHKGKLDTEALLDTKGVAWTSIRPVYIYGPLNYNPVEEWFFHRLAAGRPIPVPNSGLQVTQLGHVKLMHLWQFLQMRRPTARFTILVGKDTLLLMALPRLPQRLVDSQNLILSITILRTSTSERKRPFPSVISISSHRSRKRNRILGGSPRTDSWRVLLTPTASTLDGVLLERPLTSPLMTRFWRNSVSWRSMV